MPFVELDTGVYCWRNLVNNKVYVGGAFRSLDRRTADYLARLPRGKCHNRHLQHAWDKYGAAAFRLEILERCPASRVGAREAHWIAALNATDPARGYNVCKEGVSRLGVPHGPEARAKMSATKKCLYAGRPGPRTGAVLSSETRAKIAAAKAGTTASQATRDKMTATRTGKPWTVKHRQAMEKKHWSRGPNAAKIAARIAAARTGKAVPAETRDKISATKQARRQARATV